MSRVKTGSGLKFQPPHINAQNVTTVGQNTAKIVYVFVVKVLFAKKARFFVECGSNFPCIF